MTAAVSSNWGHCCIGSTADSNAVATALWRRSLNSGTPHHSVQLLLHSLQAVLGSETVGGYLEEAHPKAAVAARAQCVGTVLRQVLHHAMAGQAGGDR